jgi:TolB-like protein
VATAQLNPEAVREQLERVLLSTPFARSERVSKLLRFLVERALEDKQHELKESVIGVEVFGRKPDYNPKVDSTVRTEAARLRTRLSKYYSTEGIEDLLLIELPKGGYVPGFRQRGPAPVLRRISFKPRWLAVGVATLGVATTAIAVGWVLHQKAPIAIAVLPLLNLNQDIASDYLADGLTSEIISDLSIIDGLAVRSQTSSFALKGKPRNVREAGGQLEADYIVEGSVLRAGEQLRINIQLVRTRDDVPVWSDKLEREMTDIVFIQDDISRGIVNNLRLKLGRGRRRYETSVEAYDLYLHARATWAQRFPGDPEVIDLFKKVTDKDPSFAPAYAGLAVAFAVQSFVSARGPGHAEALEEMRAAGERAIQLDPLLAEAHTALGAAYARDGQWQQAERSFRRAIQIDPNSFLAHQCLARFFLCPLGRIEEAVREMRAAERNDPLSPMAHMQLADALLSAGRFDDSASECEKVPADNGRRNECLGRARLAQRRIAEAIPLLAASATQNWGYLAYSYAKAGRREEAEKLMIEGPALYPNRRGAFQFALAFAGFEDKDRTIEHLERWIGVGPGRMGFTLNSPEFAFLRGDPRVKALRNRLGLPE